MKISQSTEIIQYAFILLKPPRFFVDWSVFPSVKQTRRRRHTIFKHRSLWSQASVTVQTLYRDGSSAQPWIYATVIETNKHEVRKLQTFTLQVKDIYSACILRNNSDWVIHSSLDRTQWLDICLDFFDEVCQASHKTYSCFIIIIFSLKKKSLLLSESPH